MLTSKVIEQGPLSAAYQETMGCFMPPKEVSVPCKYITWEIFHKIWFQITTIDTPIWNLPLNFQRQKIKDWTFQAAGLHRKAGQPDACASLLEKVGRSLEAKDPECTILMLEMAAETVETENRPFQAACYTSRLLK